jgi:hypothetical protein
MAATLAVLLVVAFYVVAAWVVWWAVPRSLHRRRTPDIPSTVPEEWVDEVRRHG